MHSRLVGDLPRFMLHTGESDVAPDGDGVRSEDAASECANALAEDVVGC